MLKNLAKYLIISIKNMSKNVDLIVQKKYNDYNNKNANIKCKEGVKMEIERLNIPEQKAALKIKSVVNKDAEDLSNLVLDSKLGKKLILKLKNYYRNEDNNKNVDFKKIEKDEYDFNKEERYIFKDNLLLNNYIKETNVKKN